MRGWRWAAAGRALNWARAAVALVWLYNGLWCKLLDGSARHRAIVAAAADQRLPIPELVTTLGVVEVVLAAWVLSRRWPLAAAWVQTAALAAMNAGGLLLARDLIPDPAGMVVMNLAFLALVWSVARAQAPPRVASP